MNAFPKPLLPLSNYPHSLSLLINNPHCPLNHLMPSLFLPYLLSSSPLPLSLSLSPTPYKNLSFIITMIHENTKQYIICIYNIQGNDIKNIIYTNTYFLLCVDIIKNYNKNM